jgi:hypothetical protein
MKEHDGRNTGAVNGAGAKMPRKRPATQRPTREQIRKATKMAVYLHREALQELERL